jgi:hypothetical protein
MGSRYSWVGLGCLAGALVCCGCAPAAPLLPIPDTVPFSGKVSLNGKPLERVLITFVPDDGVNTESFSVGCLTDEQGEYELVTRNVDQEKPGAVPGNYKVVVMRLPSDPSAPKQVQVPARYSDPAQTTLEATIPDDGGTQDFELKGS